MRRVGRGGSPEVVAGPYDYSSPCSSAETNFRELDDVFLQTQTRIWLGEVLHVRFDEETSIADLLADGELLFQVSKAVWRMLLKKHAELKYSKIYIHERASFRKSGGRYMAYPKVDSFLRICQILGLTSVDLFSPSDVVEKRDTRRVCMCVRSLSKKARTKDLNVPDFDIVTYTIAMPTYMVGSIRRRLEQSWWSSKNSNICTPCMDFKEIYNQRSLDSDYMWHHSSCSESDDAEDAYRENELHSPASITSYDDADISCLTGDNFPENGSVAEEDVYPSQNFFTLTWEQDESVFKNVESVATYLDTSVHFLPSNAISDKDMSWLQSKNHFCTEIHKFDVGHSSSSTLSSRDLACQSGSCLALDAKEEKYEASTSLQDDSIACSLPESYTNLDSVNEEFSVGRKPLTCITEGHDSTCMLLLEKVTKESSRDVLECNVELSECNSAVLLDSVCENSHAEVHLMDIQGNVVWDNHNVSHLNAGSHVNENLLVGSPESLAGNSNSIIKNISNHSSISHETVADGQSGLYVGESDVNPRCIESKLTSEIGNSDVSLATGRDFENTVTAICEDISDTDDCRQIVGFQSPEHSSQMDLIDVLTLEGLPLAFDDGGSSICASNEATPIGNGVDSMSGRLYNLNVGTRGLDSDSAVYQESQSSSAIGDPCFQNQVPSDNNFLGLPHMDSICEELGLCQVSGECCESNSKYPPRNRQHNQVLDVMDGTSDSSTDCGKESVFCNGIAFPATEERSSDFDAQLHDDPLSDPFSRKKEKDLISWKLVDEDGKSLGHSTDFNAQLHDDPLSSGPISRKNNAFTEKDFISWKLVDEDGKSFSSAFEDIKQIPTTNFCKNEVERQSRAKFLGKDSSIDVKIHQIVVEGKGCGQPVENRIMHNLWMEGLNTQTAGVEQTLTEEEGKSLFIDAGKTCCPCCGISDGSVEDTQRSIVDTCAGNNMNCCTNNKVQQAIHCKFISETHKEEYVAHYGTVLRSLYAEESTVSILHLLDTNCRQSKGSEELSQEDVQKMDYDSSLSASHPMVDFLERQISVGTGDDRLDQAVVCALKTGGSEMDLASSLHCLHTGSLDTDIRGIHPTMHYDVCFSDSDTTATCNHVSSTDHQELGGSRMHREGSPCLTACVLDKKNSTECDIEVFNLHRQFMDEDANNVCDSEFDCAEILKDVEDDARRTLVGPDESKREEAAGKRILLKSFAGGVTVLGALFLFLRFRRRDARNVVLNIAKLQKEKASQERHPDKDKSSRLYPAKNFKF